MTAAATTGGRFDIGRVISRAFGAIGHNFASFAFLTLLLYAVPQFAVQYLSNLSNFASDDPRAAALRGLASLGGVIVSLILSCVLQAALVSGAVAYLRGRNASMADGLRVGFGVFMPLIGLAILLGLGEGLGLLALVVPGLILITRWSVAIPTLVIERGRGITGSMGRSADLTQGNRWNVFALLLIYTVVGWLFSGLGFAVMAAVRFSTGGVPVGQAWNPAALILNPVALGVHVLFSSVVTMIGAVGAAALYFELRSLKEGVAVSDLASVFD